MAGWRHFKLLLWKNFLIQRRHPVATVVQLVVPVLLAVVLVLIRQETDTITYSPPQHYNEIPLELCPLSYPSGANQSPGSTVRVTFAPTNPVVNLIMKVLVNRTSNPPIETMGFATEVDLLHFVQFESNRTLDVVSIVFPDLRTINDLKSGNIAYKIRFPIKPKKAIFSPKDNWYTQFTFPTIQKPGPRNVGDPTGGDPYYCTKGFVSVQHNIAMAIGTVLNDGVTPQDEASVSIQRFPYPAYYDDLFLVAIRQFLPLIIMLSFLYPAFDLVKNLVLEKEKRLKESMKIMGLHGFLHWSSWFVKSLIFFTISTLVFVFLLCCAFGNTAVLLKSDPTLIFVFLMLYVFSGISFCCMLSTFFSKANSAATAGGIIWFLIYFPYFFLEKRYDTMTYFQKMLSCLLCNTCMAFGSMQVSLNEGASFGMQWRLVATPSTPDDSFCMADVFVMLIVDSVIYLLVTWYVDAVFPGEYGMPLPWYFPIQKHYWCKSAKMSMDRPRTAQQSSDVFEDEPMNMKAGVQIQGLTKVFGKSKIAVSNLNLNMYENQITVLLGHNGAGKTTTMSMLTGLFPPTSGQAYINGFEIHRDIESVRDSLGLCPQFNVLFDDLTVEEHLYFSCKLKGCPANQMQKEIHDMLVATNLVDKRKNLSPTLSGGMKRRLCVGMAFVGGSKVVMLDEPTSGMDPAARRFTWELLQSQGKGRTILLTTHFMDEADILGDRIAIMAHGQLHCCGTSMFLKKKYGAGYHLIMVKEPGCDVSTIKMLVKGIIPKAELESNIGAELSFVLPHSSSSNFPKLFGQIEDRKQQLKISSYGASVTTLEEVFLRVGEESDATLKKKLQGDNGFDHANGKYKQMSDESPVFSSRKTLSDSITVSIEPRMAKYRNHGFKLVLQQFWAMFVKRILHSRRNWLLIFVQLVIPILITVIILIVVNMVPSQKMSPPLKLNLSPFRWSRVTYDSKTSSGKSLASLYADQFAGSNDKAVEADVDMDNYMLMVGNNDSYDYSMHYIIGGTFAGRASGMSVVAWFNNQPYHSPAISLAAIDTALLRSYTGIADLKLTVINHPLPETVEDEVRKRVKAEEKSKKDKNVFSVLRSTTTAAVKRADDIIKDTMIGFQIAFNIMFGMSFLVSSFIVFLVKEKACDAKHLQFVSGVNSATFWISTFAWDFINFIVPCLGVMLVFLAFGQDGYNTLRVQGSMFLLFCVYGWCVLPFTYLSSFLFSVASTAYARVIMFNIFSGVVTLITVSIMSLLDSLEDTAVTLDWVFLALPNYCLAGAMKSLYDNYRGHKYCSGEYPILASFCTCDKWICLRHTDSYLDWKAPGIGRNLVFLFIWGVVYFLLILLLEVGLGRRFMSFLYSWKLRKEQKFSSKGQDSLPLLVDRLPTVNSMIASVLDEEDDDVANERARIHNDNFGNLLSNNTLLIKDLTKYYGLFHPFRAVDNLCVGVPRGECFGLLGINGAGKTSTFKMLTGDEMVSSGDAFVSGYSVRRQMKMVRHRLGYCPQFDAIIDQMTGRETLVMFARLRGVPEKEIPTLVQTLSTNLLFSEHIDKLVRNYSGGNKRKLSTAVALVGDPPIIFLDEPTTGMDPMARRFVWDTISKVRDGGSSIILTTHSMEECDALCTRLAIMVNGRFQCLGSSQHLKNKFGKGYTLTAKIHHNAQTAGKLDELTENLQRFITKAFPGSLLKDLHQGMVHYHIPNTIMSWANIFGALEKAKVHYHLEDYSIGQTTLEQVFLSFTRKQQDGKDIIDT